MSDTFYKGLIDELEVVLKDSAGRRLRTLQRLSELLRSCAERLNPLLIGVFDDVLIRLLDCVGASALAELSNGLADFATPPEQTVRHLARHENAAVAAPLPSKSTILTDEDLSEVVRSRRQLHPVAVASRQHLSESLTDFILKLGGSNNRHIPPISTQQLDQAKEIFEMLFVSTAQYTIRFEPPGGSNDNAMVAGGRA